MSNLIEKLNTTMDNDEKNCLIKAWNLLKDTTDDLYAEDLEDTDEYFFAAESCKALGRFLDVSGIEYEEVETGTAVYCGITDSHNSKGTAVECSCCQREDAPCDNCFRNPEIADKGDPDLKDYQRKEG